MTQKNNDQNDSNYWELLSKYIYEGIHVDAIPQKHKHHLYPQFTKHKEGFEQLCTEFREDQDMGKKAWRNIEEELLTSGKRRSKKITIFCIVCLFWSILIVFVLYLLLR
ncbi:hypothetical protein K4L44_14965 [Halosquirtibacter laminarini]|uniref:Uncharacterized protein n=1 Tax=Halosquirtibacter laminarini TaxID=3374600 RepID=A0AC61NE65_9BACT|nr:hypothetical protein K4L44_14965 [Prolixibacteraceae bacterium]